MPDSFFLVTLVHMISVKKKFEQTCEELLPNLFRGLANDMLDIDLNVYLTISSQSSNYSQI